jgi:tetratricopeptide (TPR) repeat protein
MQALASTGSIAVSEQTRKLVEGYFALKPLGPTKVKGVTEPVNVYEVTGFGPLRTRLQRSAGRGLTKFVGREREMEALARASEQARAGSGQIVAAMAEAGTGKSRLCFEFKVKNQSGWMVLETFSVSHGKASAYFPVIDLLHNYFKITGDDDERSRRAKVIGAVLALDCALEDTLPYFFALLGIIEGDDPLAETDAQVRKRRTLDAIKRILLRESLNQPLMVIFEDLHWIDEETQAFLNLLADSIGTAKILLLVNYRPEYSHQWGSKTYYTQLRLDPLGKESADEMLSAMLGDGAELAPLKRLIIERTEGNPFFMEETVQVLLDEGALKRDGAAVKLTKALGELKIPPTVQAILAARIDRLAADEKDLLQTLAVIGREFPLSLIREVVAKPDDELNRMLNDLQLGEFIYEQPAMGDVEYTFKHALTQEVAYNSVLMERRRVLHDRAGKAIEALYADHLDDRLAELAHHFARSANVDKAVQYLTLAGKQSLERFAYTESEAQLSKGADLLRAMPDSPERDALELELAVPLVQAMWRCRGVDAPETRAAAERAATIAEKTGNLTQLIFQLNLIRVAIVRTGDYAGAAVVADRALALALRQGSPASLAAAYHGKLQSQYYKGDLAGTEALFALWRNFQGTDDAGNIASAPIVLAFASWCALQMGRIETARERIAEAVAAAHTGNEPFTRMIGGAMEGMFYRLLREPGRVEAAASQSLALVQEHDLIGPNLFPLKGWARAQLGSTAEGVSLIRQAFADPNMRIGGIWADAFLCLAEAQILDGKLNDAMVTIEEALQANSQEVVQRPEMLRVRGELRHKLGDLKDAETDLREAIALLQKMGAKFWELRATTSLARLMRDTDRRDEARAMLADIYNWFTEGFDTADLKDAKALLDEL